MKIDLNHAASSILFRTLLLSFIRVYWRPKLRKPSPLPKRGPCFFYGNHSNRWDPFILNCFTPYFDGTGGVMTQEFFRTPFLAWALRSLDLHPTRKRIAEPHLIRTLYRMLNEGRKVVIYPEGGSRWTGRPDPWITSTAKVFVKAGVPVYPVVMHGSYTSWPRWATYPRPGRVEVEVLPPLTFERRAPLDEAMAKLKAPILFDENDLPDRLRPRWAYRPAAGIEKLLYRDPQTGTWGGLYTPDGTRVASRDGDLRFTMLPDSRLRDEATGDLHLTGKLYDQVKALPVLVDADGAFLRNRVAVHHETEFPNLQPRGDGEAVLFADAIRIKAGDFERTLGLEALVNVGIERNFKLQLFGEDEMVQLSVVHEGSALAWQDAITRLQAPAD